MKNAKLFWILIAVAMGLAFFQTSAATPWKFIVTRNLGIVWFVYWWNTKNIKKDENYL